MLYSAELLAKLIDGEPKAHILLLVQRQPPTISGQTTDDLLDDLLPFAQVAVYLATISSLHAGRLQSDAVAARAEGELALDDLRPPLGDRIAGRQLEAEPRRHVIKSDHICLVAGRSLEEYQLQGLPALQGTPRLHPTHQRPSCACEHAHPRRYPASHAGK